MVFAWCIRRSASTFATVCGRVARAQTISVIANRSSSLVPKPSHSLLRPFVSRVSLYTTAAEELKSDQTLVQLIDSETNCVVVEELACDELPFEIKDNPGRRNVTLTREYNGEQIKVEVTMPENHDLNEDDTDDDEDGDVRNKNVDVTTLQLVVTVTKKSGLGLVFKCTGFGDLIVIDGLSVKHPEDSEEEEMAYDGPDFQELDETMRKSFHKFLETRGIKASAMPSLYECMMKKGTKEYLMWLKNLKNIIQDQGEEE